MWIVIKEIIIFIKMKEILVGELLKKEKKTEKENYNC